MKSFAKFIGFLVGWCIAYYFFGRLFNWGLDFLSGALNLDTTLGMIILIAICSSVMWTILFYPTLMIGGMLLDKKIYGTIALLLMALFNIFIFVVFSQYGLYMIIVWAVHAFSTVMPLWMIQHHLASEENKEKERQEQEYKEKIKAEIIKEMQNGNS